MIRHYTVILLLCCCILCGCHADMLPQTTTPTTLAIPAATFNPTLPETTVPTTIPPTTAPKHPVDELLESMSVEALVGQMFLSRCPSVNTIADLIQYQLGGYILFGRDFNGQTPQSMLEIISQYQNASPIPLLIAVDEEGGTVTRVSSQSAFRSSRFPSPRQLFRDGGMELVVETEAEKCQLLASIGINVNVGPVCDITTDSGAFMYHRSIGLSTEETGEFVSRMVATMQQHKIGNVLKHFPGYGNNSDTHTGIAIDSNPLSTLEAENLKPFMAGIAAGCDAIMVSHTIITAFDDVQPATLSPAVHDYLRNTMGFDGVIVTDDLVMKAITDLCGDAEAAVLAVLAGNDLLCVSNYPTQYQAVLDAVYSGRISEERLRDSVRRILMWKYDLGLLS